MSVVVVYTEVMLAAAVTYLLVYLDAADVAGAVVLFFVVFSRHGRLDGRL